MLGSGFCGAWPRGSGGSLHRPLSQSSFVGHHGGHWRHAWPISACGLRLDDEAVRVAVGLRIGVDLCEEHDFPCGTKVDSRGSHGLSCRRGAGRLGVRQRYDFPAIAVETLSPMNEDGVNSLLEIGRRLSSISGDPRETSFLLRRVSVTLQRYNAIAFRGSFQRIKGF